MGKLIALIILAIVFKINGQFSLSDLASVTQNQPQGELDFATSIFSGVASGIGLNLNGHGGFKKHPQHSYNYQHANIPPHIPVEADVDYQSNEYYYPSLNKHRPRPSPRPPQYYPNSPRPHQHHHHNKPSSHGHGDQDYLTHNGPEDNYNKPSYNENGLNMPGYPSQHHYGNGNNENYGNQYPNNPNLGITPGYNHGYNDNGRPSGGYQVGGNSQSNHPARPTHQSSQSLNKPSYVHNNQYNENNQEYQFSQIFGTPQNPNSGYNSGSKNPGNGGLITGNLNSNTDGFHLGTNGPYNGGFDSGSKNPYNGGFNSGSKNPNNGGLVTETPNSNSGGFYSGINNPNNEAFNSGTQNPNNGGFTLVNQNLFSSTKPSKLPSNSYSPQFNADKVTEEPNEGLPTFVALIPNDNKKETETQKPAAENEDFEIDIRNKGE